MNKLINMARRFQEEESGAAMVEYAVLIGLITVATVAMITLLGAQVLAKFTATCTSLKGSAC